MAAHLTPETMRFLRGLAKHNDRTWFEERRPVYERAVKVPFQALIDEINAGMAEFAPEHIRPAHKIAMRIFRDTRFSPDQRPYKDHLAAWWARAGLEKTSAAGFFLRVHPAGLSVAAGVYAPERDEMLLLRRWLAEAHEHYRETVAKLLLPTGGQLTLQPLEPNPLTRNPKGFAPDHPAGDLLRQRNWGVLAQLPAEVAVEGDVAKTIAAAFQRMAPLVQLLNEPFLVSKAHPKTSFLR